MSHPCMLFRDSNELKHFSWDRLTILCFYLMVVVATARFCGHSVAPRQHVPVVVFVRFLVASLRHDRSSNSLFPRSEHSCNIGLCGQQARFRNGLNLSTGKHIFDRNLMLNMSLSSIKFEISGVCVTILRSCFLLSSNIFNDHNSSNFLRQSDFSIPSYNTVTYGKHSLRYLGPRLRGKLSSDVRSAKNLNTFKNKIRKCDVSSLVNDGCKGCSLSSS